MQIPPFQQSLFLYLVAFQQRVQFPEQVNPMLLWNRERCLRRIDFYKIE